VPAGIFPKLTEEGNHCCLEQRRVVRGDTHPELLGKGEGEAEDWGKRVFPGSVMRDY
jgi:hypothetical protein